MDLPDINIPDENEPVELTDEQRAIYNAYNNLLNNKQVKNILNHIKHSAILGILNSKTPEDDVNACHQFRAVWSLVDSIYHERDEQIKEIAQDDERAVEERRIEYN